MSGKTKKKSITSLSGTTNLEIPTGVKAGDVVSLDLRHRGYFAVGSFELCRDKPTETIPENLTNQQMTIIQRAINSRQIVMGDKSIPRITRDISILEQYIAHVEQTTDVRKDLHPHVSKLAKVIDKIGGYSKHEILEEMLRYEMQNRCRAIVMEYLNYAMDKIPGVTKVRDYVAQRKTSPVELGNLDKPPILGASEEALKEL